MSETTSRSAGIAERAEAIESAYEFMLAYAAQGRRGGEGGAADEVRSYLERLDAALEDIGTACRETAADSGELLDIADFIEVLENDAAKTRAAVRLVLSKSRISSLLVDNLNASIHLRALLTDLFVIDQALANDQ